MTAATLPTLRPLSMGQILDQAIRLYRHNFVKFVGIIAVVQVPLTLLQALFGLLAVNSASTALKSPTPTLGAGYWGGMLGTIVFGILSFVLVQGVAAAALTRAVADHYLGEETGLLESYQRIGKAWPRLVGALLFSLVVGVAIGVWTVIPCIGWLTGFGILVLFSQGVMPLVAPAVVLEGQPALSALTRAWNLVRRRFWWVVGFVGILYLFNLLVVGGPTILLSTLSTFFADRLFNTVDLMTATIVQTAIQSLITMLLSLLYLPLQLTCMTLLYFDLRVRTEGLDLALLAEGALTGTRGADAAAAIAPPAEVKGLMTWQELGYFALMSLGVLALFAILYGILIAIVLAIYAAAGVG